MKTIFDTSDAYADAIEKLREHDEHDTADALIAACKAPSEGSEPVVLDLGPDDSIKSGVALVLTTEEPTKRRPRPILAINCDGRDYHLIFSTPIKLKELYISLSALTVNNIIALDKLASDSGDPNKLEDTLKTMATLREVHVN